MRLMFGLLCLSASGLGGQVVSVEHVALRLGGRSYRWERLVP